MAETKVQETEAEGEGEKGEEKGEGEKGGTDMYQHCAIPKPLIFRKPGSPAGSHPPQPWHICKYFTICILPTD
eukprot:1156703-Pelagomonas_calceolata.AAC.3